MSSVLSRQIYKPLVKERREIRVLHVFGPRNEGLLRAHLRHVSLDSRPSYEAISYCWAEVPGDDYLMLDGAVWKAPASAVKVLRQFQPVGEVCRILWIDAICINQNDIEEKGHQVRMMEDVYRQCQQALVWLGDYDETVDNAVTSMNVLMDDMDQRTAGYESPVAAYNEGAWDADPQKDEAASRAIGAAVDVQALHLILYRQ